MRRACYALVALHSSTPACPCHTLSPCPAPPLATCRWATFVGLGILLVTTPITSIFMKKIVGYRREMLKYTDQVGSRGREARGGRWLEAVGA